MQDINLTTLAREVAADSGLHDPREIAEKMLAGMSGDEMSAALRATLPGYVRDVIGSQQRQAMRRAFRPNRSAKVQGIRDWWAEMLASSVYVNGEWKSFGDCTRSDVGWLAEQRRAEAARNLAQAAVYDEVDALMAEHGVETLSGLPRDVVPASLSEVAA